MPLNWQTSSITTPVGRSKSVCGDGLPVIPVPLPVERDLHEVVPQVERAIGAEQALSERVGERLLVVVAHPHAGDQAPRHVAEAGHVAEVVGGPGLEAGVAALAVLVVELRARAPQHVGLRVGVALQDPVGEVRLGIGHRLGLLRTVVLEGVDDAVVAIADLQDGGGRVKRPLLREDAVGAGHVGQVDRHRSEAPATVPGSWSRMYSLVAIPIDSANAAVSLTPTRYCIITDGTLSE